MSETSLGRLPKFDFKLWEKALVVAGAVLFAFSMWLYLGDFPLRQYLFNFDDEGVRERVGTVSIVSGRLRRQVVGEAEFKTLGLQSEVFNEDTVVTGSDGKATLLLDDGSTIELDANTMVSLRFESTLGLGGISRAAAVKVVTGNVTGESKQTRIVIRTRERVVDIPRETKKTVSIPKAVTPKLVRVIPTAPEPTPVTVPIAKPRPLPTLAAIPTPTATPTPIITPTPVPTLELVGRVELVLPKPGAALSVAKGMRTPEKPVAFIWKIAPPERQVLFTLNKLVSDNRGAVSRQQIHQGTVLDVNGQGKVDWVLIEPGVYEWELRRPSGELLLAKKPSRAQFRLEREFEAIELQEPLVGGLSLRSSRLQGEQLKNFDITFRWKPFPGVENYQVAIKAGPNEKNNLLERTVSSNQYVFNKDKVLSGQIYYQVSANLPGGFVARSEVKPFSFAFLPPSLVVPVNHSVITRAALATEGNSVLFTWEKTNFTELYEIQIALDSEFKKLFSTKTLKENFYVLKSPKPGKYWWRVRSSSKSVMSMPSAPNDFIVQ